MMGLSNSIVSLFLTLGAVFAFGTLAVCVFMVVGYLIMKDGTKSACRAIENFFGSGCRVSTRDHTITVMQVVPVLELATASGEFQHSYDWHRDKRRFLGLPLPFTGKAAACRHEYVVKAGFDLKERFCVFDFTPVGGQALVAKIFEGRCYHVKVRIPRPKILSLETRNVNVEDRARWFDFWNGLNNSDRNLIMAEMFTEARNHVANAGVTLLDEAQRRLEGGLRAIMPAHVKNMEFEWLENPKAYDFECRDKNNVLS
ncbi:MAG: DUF4230 domain-containing protein [Lentisphaerae bacterium]|nr:DUF4230 domain-containing protein [Lentisphaerota bacterium]